MHFDCRPDHFFRQPTTKISLHIETSASSAPLRYDFAETGSQPG